MVTYPPIGQPDISKPSQTRERAEANLPIGGGAKLATEHLHVSFGEVQALRDVTLQVHPREILGIIGPANSGKTTLLRTFNRLNDLLPHVRTTGRVLLDGRPIDDGLSLSELRRRVGMVFALPITLPMTIFDNVAYGPRLHGTRDRATLERLVEGSLRAASLWDEAKDRLRSPATNLSGGQQQRLCIARTLALEPEVILFDEPCSGLDPISTARVEEAMVQLQERYTIVLVTNNTKQAARVSDRVAFFLQGELMEVGTTAQIFTAPQDRRTDDYIAGRFG